MGMEARSSRNKSAPPSLLSLLLPPSSFSPSFHSLIQPPEHLLRMMTVGKQWPNQVSLVSSQGWQPNKQITISTCNLLSVYGELGATLSAEHAPSSQPSSSGMGLGLRKG